jgi:hypothetical protein
VRATFVPAPDAILVVERAAAPQLPLTARAIAEAIPPEIPVHHGVAKRITRVTTETVHDSTHPLAQVLVRSPFWHFIEYGTRFSPPYRSIENAVRKLGLRYVLR